MHNSKPKHICDNQFVIARMPMHNAHCTVNAPAHTRTRAHTHKTGSRLLKYASIRYIPIYTYLVVCVCVCHPCSGGVSVHSYVYVYAYAYICLYVHVHAHAHVYVCVCVCARVCVFVHMCQRRGCARGGALLVCVRISALCHAHSHTHHMT